MADNKVGRVVRGDGDEQVNVVGHDFQCNYFASEFRDLLAYQNFTSFFDIAHQAFTALLRTKNDVVIQVVNAVASFLIIACHQEDHKPFFRRLSRKCRTKTIGQFLPCLKAEGVSLPTITKGLL